MAGGYGAGSASNKGKFLINTVYAPSTVTTAETFIWYGITDDLKLGVAHLWKQNSFRFLGSYQFLRETGTTPALFASVGIQGIGTGNPGYSVTAEKNFQTKEGMFNLFAGVGLRSNENHAHPVIGSKFSFLNGLTLGLQNDGHETHPFVTYSRGSLIAGFYLINGKRAAYMLGTRF